MRSANVAALTLNDVAFNATKGITGGEFADQYRDALLAQAIETGVGETMIQSYRNAAQEFGKMTDEEKAAGGEEWFRNISQDLVDMINTVEE
jgi:hypothetical protein